MTSTLDIINNFMQTFDASGANSASGFSGMTFGVVVDTDDPLQMGRLRVFCPTLNDDPKQVQYVPWAVYISPFGGVINNKEYTRGSDKDHNVSKGPVHYGFWAVPELGAHVLVGCVDGDYRRRFWIGCAPSHLETNTIHGGRWEWKEGKVDGPLTSTGDPIEPQYSNFKQAFDDKKESPEWKSRAAEYQVSAIRDDFEQTQNSKKKNIDQTNKSIKDNEPWKWTHDSLGSHGYDWTGFKNMGAFFSSRTFGFSSPGLHSLVMDDRPFNSRIKLRTTSGHQIILDDSNERIYISTNTGNNWMEFDSQGNIDMYSGGRVSIHAADDLNLSATGSVRIYAGENLNLYAGHNVASMDAPEDLEETPGQPVQGTISIQSEADINLKSTNLRSFSSENVYMESSLNYYGNHGDSVSVTAVNDHTVSTVSGDLISSGGNAIYSTSVTETKSYSEGTMSHSANGDIEAQSFNGTSSTAANSGVRIKSANSNVDVEAGMIGGTGSVNLFAPGAQHTISNDGIATVSSGNVAVVSGSEVAHAVQNGLTVDNNTDVGAILSASNINLSRISSSNIFTHAAYGDIVQKTIERGHSFNKIGDQIDELTANLNTLTMQTSMLYDATKSAIDALHGSLSLSFSFDVGCALNELYNLLPQQLLDAFATYQDIKQALQDLGYVVDSFQDMMNLISNTSIQSLLGLPNISIDMSIGSGSCTSGLPRWTSAISYNTPSTANPERLRDLIHSIFEGGSQIGEPPPVTDIEWSIGTGTLPSENPNSGINNWIPGSLGEFGEVG